MLDIVKKSLACNGNGAAAINARGLSHRAWTSEQRVAAAADAALGMSHVVPSLKLAATAFGVSVYMVRQELKTRAKAREDAERAERATAELDEAYAANRLIDAWRDASSGARRVAVCEIGVANVWDVIANIVG